MKKSSVCVFAILLLELSVNLGAHERKRAEICLAGGIFTTGSNGSGIIATSLGYNFKFVGAEVYGAIIEQGTVLGANLLLGFFEYQPFIPYVIGGIWTIGGDNTIVAEGSGFNVGGGIKIKLMDAFAVRAEIRRYFVESHWGVNTFTGGISLFF